MIKGDVGDFSAEKIVSVAEKILNKDKVDCVIAHYLGGTIDIKAFGGNEVPCLHMDTSNKIEKGGRYLDQQFF